ARGARRRPTWAAARRGSANTPTRCCARRGMTTRRSPNCAAQALSRDRAAVIKNLEFGIWNSSPRCQEREHEFFNSKFLERVSELPVAQPFRAARRPFGRPEGLRYQRPPVILNRALNS